MAEIERENEHGFVDKRYDNKSSTQMPGNVDTNLGYNSVGQLRTALIGALPAYYTTARLNNMTKNDMIYATRIIADPAGI